MDQLVELIDACDVYVMLTLDNSSDFQGRSWQNSSYNTRNGGPAVAPMDFFTNAEAKAQYKNRLRYLVARWGYSPHIAAWEFFNEIDNLMYGLPERIPDEVVTSWHTEMSEFLSKTDPYHHLITTSISHRAVKGLYDVPAIDFNQVHIYGHDGQSRIADFSKTISKDENVHGKPPVIGEYGFEWDWNKNFDAFSSSMDYDFKKGLWVGLFSPTPILPMSWWWEYFDRKGTAKYIQRVRSILDQMLVAGSGKFEETKCSWGENDPSRQAMAVQCGATTFVLLINDSAETVTSDVSLSGASQKSGDVFAYDPEQGMSRQLGVWDGNSGKIASVTVSSKNFLILKVSPPAQK
jgi:hypothetical protein